MCGVGTGGKTGFCFAEGVKHVLLHNLVTTDIQVQ